MKSVLFCPLTILLVVSGCSSLQESSGRRMMMFGDLSEVPFGLSPRVIWEFLEFRAPAVRWVVLAERLVVVEAESVSGLDQARVALNELDSMSSDVGLQLWRVLKGGRQMCFVALNRDSVLSVLGDADLDELLSHWIRTAKEDADRIPAFELSEAEFEEAWESWTGNAVLFCLPRPLGSTGMDVFYPEIPVHYEWQTDPYVRAALLLGGWKVFDDSPLQASLETIPLKAWTGTTLWGDPVALEERPRYPERWAD